MHFNVIVKVMTLIQVLFPLLCVAILPLNFKDQGLTLNIANDSKNNQIYGLVHSTVKV